MSQTDQSGFNDRLKRIQKGGANTMGEVHIGPGDEVRANQGHKSRPTNTVRMKAKNRKNIVIGEGSNKALVPLALIFGAMSMFVGQAASFHLFQEGGLVPVSVPEMAAPYMAYAPIAIGGTLALLFAWTFRFSGFLRGMALIAGCASVFIYHAELVQKAPGLYTSFFTEEYVASVLAKV